MYLALLVSSLTFLVLSVLSMFYTVDILKLFGGQGQRSRPFYGSDKVKKGIKGGA